MEEKLTEISLGESICIKIKAGYFPDTPWPNCHKLVAKKFTELKAIARKFYSGKSDVEMLKELINYTIQDILDACST